MKFNLGGDVASESRAGKSTRIKANQIVDVTFKGCFAEDQPSKDGNDVYKVLKSRWEDKDGLTFEDTIFEPRNGDDVRKENNFGYENPSAVEEIQFKIKHLISAVAPEVAQKMNDKKDGVQFDGWESIRQFVAKNTAKAIGKQTQIKLLADKDGYARFPGFVLGINKAGDVYPKTNFIGANLSFTAKEAERIEKTASAVPTSMPAKTAAPEAVEATGGDLDLDLDLA